MGRHTFVFNVNFSLFLAVINVKNETVSKDLELDMEHGKWILAIFQFY